MRYAVIIGDEQHDVSIAEDSPSRYRVRVGDTEETVELHELPDGSLSLVHGTQSHHVWVEDRLGDAARVVVGEQSFVTEVVDMRTMRLREAQGVGGDAKGPATVESPMPGKVVAVLVKEGAEVEADQGLVVVEAMKMENELRAPKAGTVTKIHISVGQAVEGGVALCEVE